MKFIEIAPKKNRGGGNTQTNDIQIRKAFLENKHIGYYFCMSKTAYENKVGYKNNERVYLKALKAEEFPSRLYLSFSEGKENGRRLYAPDAKKNPSQRRRCTFKGYDLAEFEGEYSLTWDANERMFYIDKNKKEA